jgi:hypothetical protein
LVQSHQRNIKVIGFRLFPIKVIAYFYAYMDHFNLGLIKLGSPVI